MRSLDRLLVGTALLFGVAACSPSPAPVPAAPPPTAPAAASADPAAPAAAADDLTPAAGGDASSRPLSTPFEKALATAVTAGDLGAVRALWVPDGLQRNLVGPSGGAGDKVVANMVKRRFTLRFNAEKRVGKGVMARGFMVLLEGEGPKQRPTYAALVPTGPGSQLRLLGIGRRSDQIARLLRRFSNGESLDPPPWKPAGTPDP